MIEVSCDRCGSTGGPIWGEVHYSPGGGRHGTEVFHFCYHCVDDLRTFVVGNVPSIPAENGVVFQGRGWMIRQDYLKQGAKA